MRVVHAALAIGILCIGDPALAQTQPVKPKIALPVNASVPIDLSKAPVATSDGSNGGIRPPASVNLQPSRPDDTQLAATLQRPALPEAKGGPQLPTFPPRRDPTLSADDWRRFPDTPASELRQAPMRCELLPASAAAACLASKPAFEACRNVEASAHAACLADKLPVPASTDCQSIREPRARQACSEQNNAQASCRGRKGQEMSVCIREYWAANPSKIGDADASALLRTQPDVRQVVVDLRR